MNSCIAGRLSRALAITASLSLALSAMGVALATSASAADRMDGQRVMTGPTGNKVEMVEPYNSTYVPHIARASARDHAKAQRILDGVNEFCRNHTVAQLKKRWRPGLSAPSSPTHLFNPSPTSRGLRPAHPRAALVYEGRLDGVMFAGVPLPSLGSIPRAHTHDMSMPIEMVHVYCTKNLRDAFTPSRMLGIKGDMVRLRLTIRPAVMDLNAHQLRAVRAKVRGYTGAKPLATAAVRTSASSGPDPVLQAMRIEIRQALMVLNEAQLRSVWSLMKSY